MRTIYSQIGLAVMVAVCLPALAFGRWRERLAAACIAASWVATLVLQRALHHVDPWASLALMDLGVFAVLVALAWRHRSGWPIYGAAAQGVALGVHVIRALSPQMPTWTYLSALAVSAYALLLFLAWGTWSAMRNRR